MACWSDRLAFLTSLVARKAMIEIAFSQSVAARGPEGDAKQVEENVDRKSVV